MRMAYQYGDAALAYILSHEYAHAAQTIGGFRPRTITQIELQADCLAGFYMGAMPNVTFDRQDIEQIAEIAYQVGDYEVNNRQPDRHTSATRSGCVIGLSSITTKWHRRLWSAVENLRYKCENLKE